MVSDDGMTRPAVAGALFISARKFFSLACTIPVKLAAQQSNPRISLSRKDAPRFGSLVVRVARSFTTTCSFTRGFDTTCAAA